ncbi:hypothetical protein ONZ51_g13296 [Trametes cubensis]|uniref:Metallo-beta-lactamase domain-containing protein n=1 Tax=Trametes cubensis TaxID=1111947 RepID=A0AAD7TEZ6_9APHY|nr:hypothetical protein ONZ51_g13296 [Trametes cubensis]
MIVENPEGCTILDVNRALAELIPFDDQHLEFALGHYQELAFTSGLSLPQLADLIFRDRGFLDDHDAHLYVVHELLFPGEEPSVEANVSEDCDTDEADVRRESECAGMDIRCDEDGFWHGIVDVPATQRKRGAFVDAGPIEQRDPCIGYIVRKIPQHELTPSSPLPGKLVLLGDTYDPSPLIPLIRRSEPFALLEPSALPEIDPTESGFPITVPVSLLVHEATDAYLPNVDPQQRTGKNRTQSSVEAKTRDRGHSTPAMAGAFARRIGAGRLVLYHIGARFPAPDMAHTRSGQDKFRLACMREIERQAAQTWTFPRAATRIPSSRMGLPGSHHPPESGTHRGGSRRAE